MIAVCFAVIVMMSSSDPKQRYFASKFVWIID